MMPKKRSIFFGNSTSEEASAADSETIQLRRVTKSMIDPTSIRRSSHSPDSSSVGFSNGSLTKPRLLIATLRVQTNQLKWSFSVAIELASYLGHVESTSATNESVLKVPLDHRKQAAGVIKSHDREVVCQKAGDAICGHDQRATAARALKSVLQGILHSSEGSDMAALSRCWSCQSSMFQKLEYFEDCC
ncbi:hypothetical protein F2Q70_00001137 [Brassica cretica]|uniref:Uncharacterized protein n=1 Tax=Brassica cretica TaxID=69181 RepID=A0A8S9J5F6_BRACR|nr:hypothetical protein F2Q70_00001137 [Brassica cretica]